MEHRPQGHGEATAFNTQLPHGSSLESFITRHTSPAPGCEQTPSRPAAPPAALQRSDLKAQRSLHAPPSTPNPILKQHTALDADTVCYLINNQHFHRLATSYSHHTPHQMRRPVPEEGICIHLSFPRKRPFHSREIQFSSPVTSPRRCYLCFRAVLYPHDIVQSSLRE